MVARVYTGSQAVSSRAILSASTLFDPSRLPYLTYLSRKVVDTSYTSPLLT